MIRTIDFVRLCYNAADYYELITHVSHLTTKLCRMASCAVMLKFHDQLKLVDESLGYTAPPAYILPPTTPAGLFIPDVFAMLISKLNPEQAHQVLIMKY